MGSTGIKPIFIDLGNWITRARRSYGESCQAVCCSWLGKKRDYFLIIKGNLLIIDGNGGVHSRHVGFEDQNFRI